MLEIFEVAATVLGLSSQIDWSVDLDSLRKQRSKLKRTPVAMPCPTDSVKHIGTITSVFITDTEVRLKSNEIHTKIKRKTYHEVANQESINGYI